MKIKSIIFALLLIFSAKLAAQEEDFKPSGTPYANIFINFHSDITDDGLDSKFENTRGYFGYKYNFSKEWSTKILLDVGSSSVSLDLDTLGSFKENTSLSYTAFLKNAGVTYKKGNLTVDMGLVGLVQFKVTDSYWGHRYIYKSLQHHNNLGTSADFGVVVDYKIADRLSVDLTVRNGEGFKKIQNNNAFLTGIGYTITILDGLVFRGYYDYYETSEAQVTLAHFIGYKNDDLSVGFEQSLQLNSNHVKDNDKGGFSGMASYNISDKYQLFGRVDLFNTKIDTDTEDDTTIITGIQYTPISKIQFALNYQGVINAENSDLNTNAVYLNANISF